MKPLRAGDPSRVGRYRLLGRLGAGGMGVVYLGRSLGGGLVALKVIQGEFAQDDGFRARFRREVAAARRVDSPWAVPVTDADTESVEMPWLATPFVPGPSLHEAVAGHGVLPVRSVRTLGGRLAEALAAVHSADLVHRDVKPANVLLALDGPRLIDFGIARSPHDTVLTAQNAVVGSPGFLSPEQARARGPAIGPPSDVFSLGCVLAYAATGRRPFGSGAAAALLFRTVYDPADLGGIPEDLLPVLEACLDKDPEARPTASALARELIEDPTPADPDGWLPAPVIRLIAERSGAMLDLPDIAATEVDSAAADADADAPSEPAVPEPPSRRRFLTGAAAAGGTVLAAGGGLAAWAVLGPDAGGAAGAGSEVPRYIIGVHADRSGADRAAGKAQENGVRLAVERLNAREDRPFELAVKVLDDGGDPDRAVTVAKEMAADRAVLAVVGPTTDATCLAAVATYSKARLPLVSVSVGTDEISVVEHPSYLGTQPRDTRDSVVLIAYLGRRLDARRTGLVHDAAAGDYSWDVVQSIDKALKSVEAETVRHTAAAGTEDFGPLAERLLGDDVDAVVFGGRSPEAAARFARALREAGYGGERMGTRALLEPRFLEEAGAAAEGWVLSSTFIDADTRPETQEFAAAHRRKYGGAPGRYAAEAFDTVHFIAKAVRDLGSRDVARRALSRRLPDTTYSGITKTFTFHKDVAQPWLKDNLYLYRVEDGRFRYFEELDDLQDEE